MENILTIQAEANHLIKMYEKKEAVKIAKANLYYAIYHKNMADIMKNERIIKTLKGTQA